MSSLKTTSFLLFKNQIGLRIFGNFPKSVNVNQYDWSDDAVEKAGYRWKGQNQKFFLVEFLGEEPEIKIDTKEIFLQGGL